TEDSVGRQGTLLTDDRYEHRWDEPAGQDQQSDPPLREQLAQLEPVPGDQRRRTGGDARKGDGGGGHAGVSASVRARNAASSGATTGANSRTATPAPTRPTTSWSSAVSDPRTRSTAASWRPTAPASGRTHRSAVPAATLRAVSGSEVRSR